MKRKKAVKVGIAGLGRSGWGIHARMIEPMDKLYQVVAVFDKNADRVKETCERFNCRGYRTYQELISDDECELVINATPSHLHSRYTIMALQAKKHVVCEKPMAMSLTSADKMIQCARKTKKILSVFQNRRYQKDFIKVKEVIDSGVLGRIVEIKMCYHGFSRRWDWQTLKKYGGGTLNNTGPHPIDQALVLFGKKTPQVFCIRDKALTLGDADDHVKVILHGFGSPTVEVEITAACAYPQDNWLVMGTQGSLAGSFSKLNWKYFNPKKLPKRKLDEKPTPDRSYNKDNIKFIEKSWDVEKDKGPGQDGFYLDLYETIRNKKPLKITAESVRRQMVVLDKCRKLAPV